MALRKGGSTVLVVERKLKVDEVVVSVVGAQRVLVVERELKLE